MPPLWDDIYKVSESMVMDQPKLTPSFGTVAIVGVGLIGGSLGMALVAQGLAPRVIGIGRDRERLRVARDLAAITEETTDLRAGLADADIIVLATTISHICSILPEAMTLAKPDSVVTDVGSTKTTIVALAGGAAHFVGGHPMAGSEKGGVEAASPELFRRATWALTPTPQTSPQAIQCVNALAEATGAITYIFSPEAHDAMVALTSHLPHVMASALMRVAAQTAQTYPAAPTLAAGSFADMTRVAASSPEIWRDVCLTNRDAILRVLDGLHSELHTLSAAVEARDSQAIEQFFSQGATAKQDWGRPKP